MSLPQITKDDLVTIAVDSGLSKNLRFKAYAVDEKPSSYSKNLGITTASLNYLIAIENQGGDENSNIKTGVAIVAKVLNGRIMGYRIYHQR